MAKLTKAQRKFLGELAAGRGYDRNSLTGPEHAMAWRLADAGLVQYVQKDIGQRFGSPTAWKFVITDAGRAALSDKGEGEKQAARPAANPNKP